jgi:hypothetical protein
MPASIPVDEVIAGGPDEFMLVRRLVLAGTQVAIGRVLAEEARRTYDWSPVPADPLMAAARRRWFERNWPQHHDRLRGVAEALDLDLDADQYHFDGLTGVPNGSACSTVYYPPSISRDGRGRLARNYDFFASSRSAMYAMLSGQPLEDDEAPMASRPYVLSSSPDDGPATTVLTMNELDGCMEGVNEHGLAVAFNLADAENTTVPVEAGPQVGLSSVQLPRFLLDTCRSVEDAKAALLDAKQYDLGVPLHYLVADASGAAFVWERGPGGDEHIVETDGGALCLTNHLLHRHPDPTTLPDDNEESMLTYQRYRTLTDRVRVPMDGAELRTALDAVRFDNATIQDYPIRTLWRTVLDPADHTMAVQFFLGENALETRYSQELVFRADQQTPAKAATPR